MNKEFYYLDGKEQKGPYSIDQLKDLNLKSDTLIWEESFDNWKQLDIPEHADPSNPMLEMSRKVSLKADFACHSGGC